MFIKIFKKITIYVQKYSANIIKKNETSASLFLLTIVNTFKKFASHLQLKVDLKTNAEL